MADLQRASARWQHKDNKAIRSGGGAPGAAQGLASPVHAVKADDETALCGASTSATDGQPFKAAAGTCPRCVDLAKKAAKPAG